MGAICTLSAIIFELLSWCMAQIHIVDERPTHQKLINFLLECWSCVSTQYWFVEFSALLLRISWALKEVLHVRNIERMTKHQYTRQKNIKQVGRARETSYHRQIRLLCVTQPRVEHAVQSRATHLPWTTWALRHLPHTCCSFCAPETGCDCVISAA